MVDRQATGGEQIEQAVNTGSRPSDLKITDMRVAVVASNYDYPIIRLYTNQGIEGLGEVRDAGHAQNALQFKSLLLGQNPLNVDMIFNTIKRFGNWGREGGGVSGIEMALWDIVGKVYGVPCYQLLGGKYRDRVRLYADTPTPHQPTPEAYAARVLGRKQLGMTFIKFDVGIGAFAGYVHNGLVGKPTQHEYEMWGIHRFAARGAVGTQLTDAGIARFVEIASAVRDAVGWDIPLAIDHFGPLTVKDSIRLGRALDHLRLAWLEDFIPWTDVAGYADITRAIDTPTLTGEDIYLWDGFRELIERRAVDIIQPDLLTSGGMLETKKIADYADRYGLPTVLHCASSPVGYMANVHCAAAINSFIALENHALDLPFWKGLVTGLDDPFIVDGYVQVPEKPGLGVELNLEGIRANLRPPSGLFDATGEWNTPRLGFWRPKPEETWE